jgi:hypothetical protein
LFPITPFLMFLSALFGWFVTNTSHSTPPNSTEMTSPETVPPKSEK